MTEDIYRRGKASVVDRVQARALEGGWCKPPVRTIMFNNFDLTSSSITLMMFSAGDKYPAVVAKLSTHATALQQEFKNLHAMQSQMKDISPVPFFLDAIDHFTVLGMQGLQGTRSLTWDERIDRMPSVVDRLISLHKCTRREQWDRVQTLYALQEPFEAIHSSRGDDKVAIGCKDLSESLALRLNGISLPRILQHGDFYFDNILFAEEQVLVVDWEAFGVISVPAYDLFCLFFNFFRPWEKDSAERFFQDKRLAISVRKATKLYFDAMNLPLGLARWMLPLTLAQQFVQSDRLGRSSAEQMWLRLVCYCEQPERFFNFLPITE